MSSSIRARGVGVEFRFDRQQRLVSPMLARLRRRGESVWGLRRVDLAAGPGESLALVGPTASGKTTLLRVIAGILAPDEGEIDVRGSVGSLLSTEAGLLAKLTGRENGELLGVLAGRSARETRASLEQIRERSGLGPAFDRPVASYSQGMRARLGFAVAVPAGVEVLLLDEVHEALDHEFRAVMFAQAKAVREGGGIVVAAGHDHTALASMCDRAVLLTGGGIVADGPFDAVVSDYLAA